MWTNIQKNVVIVYSNMLILVSMLLILSSLVATALVVAFVVTSKKNSKTSKNSTSGGNVSSKSTASKTMATDAAKPGGSLGAAQSLFGKFVLTNFSFENNTPCNSMSSASGRPLVPFVSCAVQFRFLKEKGGGPWKLGDSLYCKFLDGRTMPNGTKHTGWLRIDTYCGDLGNDDYCFQSVDGNKSWYPVLDLYIGSFPKSGQKCTGTGGMTGPAGRGQELTDVKYGPAPQGKLKSSYGGSAKGTGKCNDCVNACVVQSKLSTAQCKAEISKGQARSPGSVFSNACWWYVPQYNDEAKGWCTSTNSNLPAKANGGA